MSKLGDLLAPALPDGLAIPTALDQAWDWMEQRGHVIESGSEVWLTPYAGERRLGPVFTNAVSLEGWFGAGDAGADRLMPFAELDGEGGVAVLWLGDDSTVRIGALGGDGAVSLLAETAVDFLRLVAIGYNDIGGFIGGEPDEEEDGESVEAIAPFRAWVEEEFAVTVPDHWSFVTPDPFNEWVNAAKGEEYRTYDD